MTKGSLVILHSSRPEFLGVLALISGRFNHRQERWSARERGRGPCGALADAAKGAGATNAGVPME
jgi:hypothetical protein